MTIEDERFEAYLRQFRPRRPRPLPVARVSQRARWTTAAVAAGLVLAAVVWSTAVRDDPGTPPAPTPPAAGVPAPPYAVPSAAVAGWDLEAVDRMLTELSGRALPDVERPDSSLYELSRLTWSER